MKTRFVLSCLVTGLVLLSTVSLEAQSRLLRNRSPSRAPRTNPAHERAKIAAEQAFERGEYQRCIDLVDSVLRQNPRDHVAYYLRAGARVELGLAQNKPQLIRAGVSDAREAIRYDTKQTAMYYFPYLYGMTNLASLENRKEHAEISVKIASQILARPALTIEDKSNLLYQRALAYISLQHFDKAARDYKAAVKINRTHLGAYIGLAEAYSHAGRSREAVEAYGRAVETFPENPLVYNNRGMQLQQLGQLKDAIDDFNRAIKLEPEYFYAFTNRGYTFLQSGDFASAEVDFTKSLQINSNQPGIYSLRSSSRLLQGNIQGAVNDQSQAVRMTPRDPASHAELGFVLFFSGDYTAAELSFEQALRLDAKMRHLNPWRFLVKELNGQTAAARQKFLSSLKPDPKCPGTGLTI